MQLKLLTYNILDGGGGREALILQVLQRARPDIVILQEVYDAQFVERLGQALEMDSYFGEGNRQRHVALLSRYPVTSFQSHHPFLPIWRNVIEAKIEYQTGKWLRVFGAHLMANLSVIFEWWRWCEARYILRCSQPFVAEPCLIGGDFNAIAPHDEVDIRTMPKWMQWMILAQGKRVYRMCLREYLKSGFIDSFRHLNPGARGVTFPTQTPNMRLDYLLVNQALKPALRQCYVVQEPEAVHEASDHYPVMLELEF